jgi:hypothetical protein
MAARFSAATERALALVAQKDKPISIYKAAQVEGITYNTLWKAIKRISGEIGPEESTVQKLKKENQELLDFIQEATETLRLLHEYASQGATYTRNPLSKKVAAMLAATPERKTAGKRGVKKGQPAKRSELTDEVRDKIMSMLAQSSGQIEPKPISPSR